MSAPTFLPELPAGWEETRSTLHAYALSVGAIPRAYADAHPKWWHVSLDLVETGLETDPVPLADKESLKLRMDLTSHEIVVTTTGGDKHTVSMTAGLTATELAERLMGIASSYGLRAEYYRDKFENDDARAYDPSIAETFYAVMSDVAAAFEEHRATLSRDVSPIQVWPHGFDLAFEWYGTRVETHEENGEVRSHTIPTQPRFLPGGPSLLLLEPLALRHRLTSGLETATRRAVAHRRVGRHDSLLRPTPRRPPTRGRSFSSTPPPSTTW